MTFQSKNETFKYPILIEIFYGADKPKKIILRRSDMLKQFQSEGKTQFFVNQDFGIYQVYYQVNIVSENKSTQTEMQKKGSSAQRSLSKSTKRPSMLEVNDKGGRIRKLSAQQRQLKQSLVKINSKQETNDPNMLNSITRRIPQLTLSKQEHQEKQIVKKDIKVNLFENFSKHEKPEPQQQVDPISLAAPDLHLTNPMTHSQRSNRSNRSNRSKTHHSEHVHSQHGHSEHGQHHGGDHGNGHGHDQGHGHGEEFHLSLKLKTVILMLIIGFLFLMYDALDDRFSRKVTKSSINIHQHDSHGHHHQTHESGKKKKSKKQKKSQVHH